MVNVDGVIPKTGGYVNTKAAMDKVVVGMAR